MKVPSSIKQALRKGWRIVGEETRTTDDERSRSGVVRLAKDGRQLSVPYTATTREGYTFDKPQLAA